MAFPSTHQLASAETGRRRRRLWMTVGVLLVALGVLRGWAVAAIEEQAARFARALGSFLGPSAGAGDEPSFDAPAEEEAESISDAGDGASELGPDVADDASSSSPPKAPSRSPVGGRTEKQEPEAPRAVFLPAARVLELALSDAAPRGRPWRGEAPGRMGVVLQGVDALGIGLRDGDVLVRVGGRPVGDTAAVIALVLEARGRKEPVIAGEVERPVGDGRAAVQRLRVVVEQPYPTREELQRRLTGNEGSLGWAETP